MFSAIVRKIKNVAQNNWEIILVLLLAATIRFTGLVKRDFWYDEAFTGVAVKEKFHDMIVMIINDVHPPLYYIALKAFSMFFDYSVFGIRLFSAIFGVATIWALYLLANELLSRRAAIFSALLATISPFAVQYSQEARMYAMLVFFILISAYFFVKGIKTDKTKFFLWWGFFTGLSMLTHYMGIIFSSTYFVVFVAWKWCEQKNISEKNIKQKFLTFAEIFLSFKKLIFGYVTALLIFSPWLKMFIYHVNMKGTNLSWVKPANFGDMIVTAQIFLFGTPLGEMSSGMPQPNEIRGIAHISIRMALAILLGIGIYYLMRKQAKAKIISLLIFSFGFMFVIYALSLTLPDQQYFVARYLLPGAFFLFILIGAWLSELKWEIVAAVFCVYIYLLSSIMPLANSQGWNEIVLHLDKYKNNNFYILNSFDYVIAKYYLGADRLTLFNYDWPAYNPSYWAAIGNELRRTENYQDIKNDPGALIISNRALTRDNQYFSTQGLVLVDQYKNILVYKYQ